MASVVAGMLIEAAECGVCREVFSEPLCLSCGHTVCRNCHNSIANSLVVVCPYCRVSSGILTGVSINRSVGDLVNAVNRDSTATDAVVASSSCSACIIDRAYLPNEALVSEQSASPRILPCGHTFCRSCIGRRFVRIGNASLQPPPASTACMLCRLGFDDSVEHPVNYQLVDIYKLSRRLRMSRLIADRVDQLLGLRRQHLDIDEKHRRTVDSLAYVVPRIIEARRRSEIPREFNALLATVRFGVATVDEYRGKVLKIMLAQHMQAVAKAFLQARELQIRLRDASDHDCRSSGGSDDVILLCRSTADLVEDLKKIVAYDAHRNRHLIMHDGVVSGLSCAAGDIWVSATDDIVAVIPPTSAED